jgi:hypothetical protein
MGCIRDKPAQKAENGGGPSQGGGTVKSKDSDGKVANFANVVIDDRIPLSARQCFSLVQSWKAIKRNMSQTGVEMFVR